MQAQIDINFEQLVKLAKQLPVQEWTKLKNEVEEPNTNISPNQSAEDMLNFLLNGPTFSKKQLDEVTKARKEINQWRTK